MSKETVSRVLEEFGTLLGVEGVQLDESGCAALGFDNVVVNFEVDEDRERLLLSAYLGEPQADRLKTYELLLDANFCWQGTGGATLSLQRATGGVVLFDAIATPRLDLQALESRLQTFVNTAEVWTAQLAQPAPSPDDSAEEPGLPNRMQSIIRG